MLGNRRRLITLFTQVKTAADAAGSHIPLDIGRIGLHNAPRWIWCRVRVHFHNHLL